MENNFLSLMLTAIHLGFDGLCDEEAKTIFPNKENVTINEIVFAKEDGFYYAGIKYDTAYAALKAAAPIFQH